MPTQDCLLLVCARCWQAAFLEPAPVTSVHSMDECFVCDSARGVVYVRAIVEWEKHEPGALLAKAHAELAAGAKRAPVQGDRLIPKGQPGHDAGSISWAEHMLAWQDYARRYGQGQSAERLAERGGFGYAELCSHLRRAPATWKAR